MWTCRAPSRPEAACLAAWRDQPSFCRETGSGFCGVLARRPAACRRRGSLRPSPSLASCLPERDDGDGAGRRDELSARRRRQSHALRRPCPSVIAAEGEITDRTPAEFLTFVEDNVGRSDMHAVFFWNSPGGKVVASMDLGGLAPTRGGGGRRPVGSCGAQQCDAVFRRPLSVGLRLRADRCEESVVPPGQHRGIHRLFFYDGELGPMGDGTASTAVTTMVG